MPTVFFFGATPDALERQRKKSIEYCGGGKLRKGNIFSGNAKVLQKYRGLPRICTYVFDCGATIKIGRTSNLPRRFGELASSRAVLFAFPIDIESQLHQAVEAYRIKTYSPLKQREYYSQDCLPTLVKFILTLKI